MEVKVINVIKDKEVVAVISNSDDLYIKSSGSDTCFCLYSEKGGNAFYSSSFWELRLADAKTKLYKGDVIQITF